MQLYDLFKCCIYYVERKNGKRKHFHKNKILCETFQGEKIHLQNGKGNKCV